MDQLTILEQIEKIIATIEKELDARYNHMQRKLLTVIRKAYEQYGTDGSLTLKDVIIYNRTVALVKQLDNVALKEYKLMLKALLQAEETLFTTTFLMLAYLLEQFFQSAGRITKLTKDAMKNAIQMAITLPSKTLSAKYKNDLIYNVHSDFMHSVKTEENFISLSKKVKKRVESSKGYFKQRIAEMLETIANAAKELVFNAVKDKLEGRKIWLSMRDIKVRVSHRALDGQVADEKGYFHIRGLKAKYPRTWIEMSENYGCRCKVIFSFFGKMPAVMQGVDYRDDKYQKALADRIDELLSNMTYKQALERAMKDIEPPKREMPFLSYEKWLAQYGEIN